MKVKSRLKAAPTGLAIRIEADISKVNRPGLDLGNKPCTPDTIKEPSIGVAGYLQYLDGVRITLARSSAH